VLIDYTFLPLIRDLHFFDTGEVLQRGEFRAMWHNTVTQKDATMMEAAGSPKMAVRLLPTTSHKRVKLIHLFI